MNCEKRKVLKFARSISKDKDVSIDVTDKVLTLLEETSMIYAFERKHGFSSYSKRVSKILRGCESIEKVNQKAIKALRNAPLDVHFLKEWQAPWPGRFSRDVDVAVRRENLQRLHAFLEREGFLARPEAYNPCKTLVQKLRQYSNSLEELEQLQFLQRQDFVMAQMIRYTPDTPYFERIEEIESALCEQVQEDDMYRFLKNRRRDLEDGDELNEVHKLIDERLYASTSPETTTRLLKILEDARDELWILKDLKEKVGLQFDREQRFNSSNPDEFEYSRGAQHVEVSALQATEASDGMRLRTQGDYLHPVDNFILDASHFCKNITNVFDDKYFNGFLKNLVDGGVLFNSLELNAEEILKRSKQLNRAEETNYYLHLLDKYRFINIEDKLSGTIYELIKADELLYNQLSYRTKAVAVLIQIYWRMKGKRIDHQENQWVS